MAPRVIGVIAVVAVLLGVGAYAGFQIAGDDDGAVDAGAPTAGAPREVPELSVPERREPDTTTTTPAPSTTVALASISIRAELVASLEMPVDLATRAGDDALYVVEQRGRLKALGPGADPETLLDISGEVSTGYEQGFLGIEFSPDGAFLYGNFTDAGGDTHVVEWSMQSGRPDPGSRRELMSFDQPFANHNGGALEFGADGFLYISAGDGGSGGDPNGNGQSLGTVLGKILRIHPRPSGNAPYAVPSSNPFLDTEGARDEVWAYGLRNPWRISFDRATGDLWIGDVGQGDVEEIDFQPAASTGGENYGWNRLEGSRPFQGSPPAQHVLPIHEYARSGDNCSVTGGFVYRGKAIPALDGVYVFADFCAGDLIGVRQSAGRATEVSPLRVHVDQVSSFGEDEDGELYVLSLGGGVFRLQPA